MRSTPTQKGRVKISTFKHVIYCNHVKITRFKQTNKWGNISVYSVTIQITCLIYTFGEVFITPGSVLISHEKEVNIHLVENRLSWTFHRGKLSSNC